MRWPTEVPMLSSARDSFPFAIENPYLETCPLHFNLHLLKTARQKASKHCNKRTGEYHLAARSKKFRICCSMPSMCWLLNGERMLIGLIDFEADCSARTCDSHVSPTPTIVGRGFCQTETYPCSVKDVAAVPTK